MGSPGLRPTLDARFPTEPVCVASISVPVRDLAVRLGADLVCYEQDGLGPALGFAAVLPSGVSLGFEELQHQAERHGRVGPSVSVDLSEVAVLGVAEIARQLRAELELRPGELDWVPGEDLTHEAPERIRRWQAFVTRPHVGVPDDPSSDGPPVDTWPPRGRPSSEPDLVAELRLVSTSAESLSRGLASGEEWTLLRPDVQATPRVLFECSVWFHDCDRLTGRAIARASIWIACRDRVTQGIEVGDQCTIDARGVTAMARVVESRPSAK